MMYPVCIISFVLLSGVIFGNSTFIGSKPLSLIVTRIKSELLLITVNEPRLNKPFYVNNIIIIYSSTVDTSNTTIRYSRLKLYQCYNCSCNSSDYISLRNIRSVVFEGYCGIYSALCCYPNPKSQSWSANVSAPESTSYLLSKAYISRVLQDYHQ